MPLIRGAPACSLPARSVRLAMPRLVLAAVLLATLAGCDSGGIDRFGREPLDPMLLAGTWTWDKTVTCGDGGGCTETTPASSGRAGTLTFTSMSANGAAGVVSGYFNGLDLEPTVYGVDIAHGGTSERSSSLATIRLEDGRAYNEVWASRSRLVISAAAVDGSETTYRRR